MISLEINFTKSKSFKRLRKFANKLLSSFLKIILKQDEKHNSLCVIRYLRFKTLRNKRVSLEH